ncbi:hypothetical protein [Rhizobium sp. FY34]|uniref:hypothetical protein n=1 Tax=Rhizobium sp. FY34 TaxID=2562309 RepID=UPI0010BF798F|nr:hypothetical protein [Rhizobium sp. FY34]
MPHLTKLLEHIFDIGVERRIPKNIKEYPMVRSNSLYLVIGALVVAVVGLGAYVVREETKPKGVEMSITSDGVKVEEN